MKYAATFGYSNYYAYYLVLVIPVFGYLAYREKNRWRRAAWALGGVVNLAILPLANNRASTLGLFGAALALVILLSLRSSRRRRVILTGLGVLAVAAVLLFGAAWGTTYGTRLRSGVTFTSDGNATARLSMWRSSVRMIADRPVQGYGLESFYYDYHRYIEEEFYNRSERQFQVLRLRQPPQPGPVHGGFPGSGGHLVLPPALLAAVPVPVPRFRDSEDPWFYGAVFCAVLANFVSVQFLYDLIPYTFYLWVLAGTAVGRLGVQEAVEEAVNEA